MSQRRWRSTAALTVAAVAILRWHDHRRHCSHQHSSLLHDETTLLEYEERRQRFLAHLPPHSITILPAADETIYTHDILHPPRQDALLYHLFGLRAPLRRQLDPPSASLTEDVRTTMAVFARGADGRTHTLLCVPPPTTNPATAVWAAETTPLAAYEAMMPSLPPTEPNEEGVKGKRSSSVVLPNDVNRIYGAVSDLIAQMATQQIATMLTPNSIDAPAEVASSKERVTHDHHDLLRVMPHLFIFYPQQLRWDGRRYRLPRSTDAGNDVGNKRGKTPAPTFHHPLEALFSRLDNTAFTVHLPRLFFEGTPQPPWSAATFHYKTAAGYTPGLVPAALCTTAASTASGAATKAPPAAGPHVVIRLPTTTRKRPSAQGMQHTFTSTVCGTVALPIRRADPYAWSYRLVKSPSQLRQHLRSARATEHAFAHLMRHAARTASEHALHCTFHRSVWECSAHFGPAASVASAYIPVIASGVRGTDIHYTDNSAVVTAHEENLVRVDAGVEVEGVPTDCTRTFPIGSATLPLAPQVLQLYDGLLQLQRKLLRRLGPGVAIGAVAKLHLDETQQLLCTLGVDVRRTEEEAATPSAFAAPPLSDEEAERRVPMSLVRSCFCAHTFGHLFGLDIHEEWTTRDAEAAATSTTATPSHVLRGGMMHTVEPGVYLPGPARARDFGLTAAQLPAAFRRGVGVQVEDDVLILPLSEADDSLKNNAEPQAAPVWSRGVYLQHAVAAFARYYCCLDEAYEAGHFGSCFSGGEENASNSNSEKKPFLLSLQAPSAVVQLCRMHLRFLVADGVNNTTAPSKHVWSAVCFLFSQRLAMEGYEAATTALAHDLAVVQSLRFVESPAYDEANLLVPCPSDTTWYPFSIVVLTASVPKDRQWITLLTT